VQNPQGEGLGRPLGQHNEAAEDAYQLVEEGFAVHRIGPGLDGEVLD
jgi:hypothetical protein